MSVLNYIIDESTVNRLTKNKAWLETYIPEVVSRLTRQGFYVVFDHEADFDLMHIHMPLGKAHHLINKYKEHRDFPIIYHGHATEDSFSVGKITKSQLRKWFKNIAGQSDLIICPSNSAMEYYRTLLPDHDMVQLNYGINLETYSFSAPARDDFRNRYGIGESELVVSCVGGISRRKGIVEFINCAKRHPEWRFMWVGGEYTQHPIVDLFYKVFARKGDMKLKDLPGNVLLTGYTTEVAAALSASDIFFFPSNHETQGLALVEAAACGRPIVTRNISVFREWLTHGTDCLMGTEEAEFDNCLVELANDPGLRERLGSAARSSAEEHHDINITSARLGQIYRELMG